MRAARSRPASGAQFAVGGGRKARKRSSARGRKSRKKRSASRNPSRPRVPRAFSHLLRSAESQAVQRVAKHDPGRVDEVDARASEARGLGREDGAVPIEEVELGREVG